MKNSIQNQVVEAVSNNVVDYFANSITSSDFIEKHIKAITPVSKDVEIKIADILAEYNQDQDNAECDAEGATQEQDKELDIIIDKCSKAIANSSGMTEGITLREHFAAMAMQGLLSQYNLKQPTDQLIICQLSVELADALLDELAKQPCA